MTYSQTYDNVYQQFYNALVQRNTPPQVLSQFVNAVTSYKRTVVDSLISQYPRGLDPSALQSIIQNWMNDTYSKCGQQQSQYMQGGYNLFGNTQPNTNFLGMQQQQNPAMMNTVSSLPPIPGLKQQAPQPTQPPIGLPIPTGNVVEMRQGETVVPQEDKTFPTGSAHAYIPPGENSVLEKGELYDVSINNIKYVVGNIVGKGTIEEAMKELDLKYNRKNYIINIRQLTKTQTNMSSKDFEVCNTIAQRLKDKADGFRSFMFTLQAKSRDVTSLKDINAYLKQEFNNRFAKGALDNWITNFTIDSPSEIVNMLDKTSISGFDQGTLDELYAQFEFNSAIVAVSQDVVSSLALAQPVGKAIKQVSIMTPSSHIYTNVVPDDIMNQHLVKQQHKVFIRPTEDVFSAYVFRKLPAYIEHIVFANKDNCFVLEMNLVHSLELGTISFIDEKVIV